MVGMTIAITQEIEECPIQMQGEQALRSLTGSCTSRRGSRIERHEGIGEKN